MLKKDELSRLLHRASEELSQHGIGGMIRQVVDKVVAYGQCPWKRLTYSRQSFRFGNQRFNYASHSYNVTWRNERAVEVPVLMSFLRKRGYGCRILELGNVSRYYGVTNCTIVDKYEQCYGVTNQDFVDFNDEEQYDGFVSISTIEHIGYDEPERDPDKILKVFSKLGSLVRDNSSVLVSFPTGYNEHLDAHLAAGRLPFQHVGFLKRIDKANHWEECSQEDALSRRYNSTFPYANAVAFGTGLKGNKLCTL